MNTESSPLAVAANVWLFRIAQISGWSMLIAGVAALYFDSRLTTLFSLIPIFGIALIFTGKHHANIADAFRKGRNLDPKLSSSHVENLLFNLSVVAEFAGISFAGLHSIVNKKLGFMFNPDEHAGTEWIILIAGMLMWHYGRKNRKFYLQRVEFLTGRTYAPLLLMWPGNSEQAAPLPAVPKKEKQPK